MKKNRKNCDLKSCVLCTHCLSDWLPAIDSNRNNFRLKKGEVLFREGQEVAGMYFIHTGLVKVHKKWGSEKELILRIAHDGDIVGHRGLGSDAIYPVSATALEHTDVCFINLDFFRSTVKVNPDFLYWLMMFFAAELKESEKRMHNLAHLSVKGRVANALLSFQKKFGTTDENIIRLYLSKQDLAAYAGATYETVFRIMNEMTEEQAISVEGRNIRILDAAKLLGHARSL
ncbi:Crp/Fnr family transcriptional regulator [Sediminibacterium soli]|uniref:Crp/Fnr family transcriptional regulator n=1 Tax=Sediminibacterium soli TaxID=2698829 RepID=UPI00137A8672|nr:Crp/Fnr family transcriptional regulator [Sediminibacterium soli]NCI47706.1 Crp/Fnr family transcriptional regulator [Sediminibacterium soli]